MVLVETRIVFTKYVVIARPPLLDGAFQLSETVPASPVTGEAIADPQVGAKGIFGKI